MIHDTAGNRVLLAIATMAIVLIIMLALGFWLEEDECPKLMLGYPKCNRWRGGYCDHSEVALREAKRRMG